MDFLRGFLLWGLLAAGLPILIHLLGRRHLRPLPIATLRFLERAQARAAARLKLRRLLLLAARIGVLTALVLLYAGPGCRTRQAEPGAHTWSIVFDNSSSMDARGEAGQTALERGRQAVLGVLQDAAPGDRFLLQTTAAGPGREVFDGQFADAARARRQVAAVALDHGPHALTAALERALAVVTDVPRARVVLVTDLQASAWPLEELANPQRIPLWVVDVGRDAAANTWIETVTVAEEADPIVRVEVELGHSGGRREETTTRVELALADGSRMTAFVEDGSARFQGRVPPGLSVARLQVEPGGDLALDDGLSFPLGGRERTRVLLVNGDPRGFELRDELLFVRQAFARSARLGQRLQVQEVRLGDLDPAHLERADVVLLANPGALDGRLAAALLAFTERGGGVVVSAGDRWQLDGEVQVGAEVLAAPPRDVVQIPPDDPSRRPFEVPDLAALGGPMEKFGDAGSAGDLGAVRVNRYWVLDARAGVDIAVWLRLENGAPLLVERRIGRGRSLLLTTTLDRDGADLCLQPAFLPWLEHLLLYAAGRLREPLAPWVETGRQVPLPYAEEAQILHPDGTRQRWVPQQASWRAEQPGAYLVELQGEVVAGFAARLPPAESDLSRLRGADLDRRLGPGAYQLGRGPQSATLTGRAGRRDVSAAVAIALLLLLAAESLLATHWRVWQRRDVLGVDG